MSSRARSALAAALGLVLGAGCAVEDGDITERGAAVIVPTFHTRYGFPGPWSREGATRAEFEGDSYACLRRSNEARREAGRGERNEVAYRAFIECMAARGWSRGVGPRARRVSDVPASRAPRPFN